MLLVLIPEKACAHFCSTDFIPMRIIVLLVLPAKKTGPFFVLLLFSNMPIPPEPRVRPVIFSILLFYDYTKKYLQTAQ
ncbi:hypothetical protein D3C75_982810 [compost metagenome]